MQRIDSFRANVCFCLPQDSYGLRASKNGRQSRAGDAGDDFRDIVIDGIRSAPGFTVGFGDVDGQRVVTGAGAFADDMQNREPANSVAEQLLADPITYSDSTGIN